MAAAQVREVMEASVEAAGLLAGQMQAARAVEVGVVQAEGREMVGVEMGLVGGQKVANDGEEAAQGWRGARCPQHPPPTPLHM